VNWIDVIGFVGTTGWCAYVWSSFLLGVLRDLHFSVPRGLRVIRAELRPFALALGCSSYLPNLVHGMRPWDYVGFGIVLACWAALRHDKDDDDRWKRRRQKLTEKVAEVGGKLVLVPAGSPP